MGYGRDASFATNPMATKAQAEQYAQQDAWRFKEVRLVVEVDGQFYAVGENDSRLKNTPNYTVHCSYEYRKGRGGARKRCH